jgi:hypothetical protein
MVPIIPRYMLPLIKLLGVLGYIVNLGFFIITCGASHLLRANLEVLKDQRRQKINYLSLYTRSSDSLVPSKIEAILSLYA